ncbi:MAG: hypothetical protein AAGH65_04195 [Pseudomonadota bacterium]
MGIQHSLWKFLLFAAGFVFFLRVAFAPADSIGYYIAIGMVVACVWLGMGWTSALNVLIAFAAWHYTDFLSDSFFFYCFLPGIATVCLGGFIIRFFRFRPVVTGFGVYSGDANSSSSGDSVVDGSAGID